MPKSKKPSRHTERAAFGLVLLLVIMGLLFVFESSVAEAFTTFGDQYYFLKQHAIRVAIGMVALLVALRIPLNWWRKLSPLMFVGSLLLLAAVFIPGISTEINGARRWLILGPVVFQPVELVKLSTVLFFAHWLDNHQRIGPFLGLVAVPAVILLLQPDLGSLLIVLTIAFGLLFVAGAKIAHLAGITLPAVGLLVLAIITSPYRMRRISTFLNPESDPLGASFHIRQITFALGNGGLFGLGIGNSKQKFNYIPEASTDSIFAIVAEEIGFVGSLLILGLFMLLFWLFFKIIRKHKPQTYPSLVGMGLLIWISFQTLLNIAAVVALVPLTGLPLPFFSYGGSSQIMILLATGILLRVGKEAS